MIEGLVIATQGPHYLVRIPSQPEGVLCFSRKKKRTACVGDRVMITMPTEENGVIESVFPRKNILYRSDLQRSKQFAANLDQLLLVVATEPDFSNDLIGRALTAAWSAEIQPVIILNKVDMLEPLQAARNRLSTYQRMGVPVLETSIHHPEQLIHTLRPFLTGTTSLLMGQSGMGKSSILNLLVPSAAAATQEYSIALGSGKHTTTHTQLYDIPELAHSAIIDSPGFQSFGLQHLDRNTIERGFPEFAPYSNACKFYNCSHRHEPKCAVVEAYKEQKIIPDRYQLYTALLKEFEEGKEQYF